MTATITKLDEMPKCAGSPEDTLECPYRPTEFVVGCDHYPVPNSVTYGAACVLHREDLAKYLGGALGSWQFDYTPAAYRALLDGLEREFGDGHVWRLQRGKSA